MEYLASVPVRLKLGGKAEIVWSSPYENINSLLGERRKEEDVGKEKS